MISIVVCKNNQQLLHFHRIEQVSAECKVICRSIAAAISATASSARGGIITGRKCIDEYPVI